MEILSRNWGWLVLRGVVSVLFGMLATLLPGITLAALVLLFGAYALVDGVAMIVWAVANHRDQPHWLSLVIGGLLGVSAGALTLLWPAMTAVALLVMIASWAIVTGIATIAAAIRLRKEVAGAWRLVLPGLLSVACGGILLATPALGALAMVLWIGGYAIVSGLLLIGFGLRLRSWGRLNSRALMSHPA